MVADDSPDARKGNPLVVVVVPAAAVVVADPNEKVGAADVDDDPNEKVGTPAVFVAVVVAESSFRLRLTLAPPSSCGPVASGGGGGNAGSCCMEGLDGPMVLLGAGAGDPSVGVCWVGVPNVVSACGWDGTAPKRNGATAGRSSFLGLAADAPKLKPVVVGFSSFTWVVGADDAPTLKPVVVVADVVVPKRNPVVDVAIG